MASEPEVYHCGQTPFVPNSKLPILVYRDVLPKPFSEEATKQFLEKNEWPYGGTWGAISTPHFHQNTHECYGVFGGISTFLLGAGPNDKEEDGLTVQVKAGDVIILPAGTAHSSKDFSDEFTYVGVYPKGAPKWKWALCVIESRCQSLREEAESVAIPEWDPVRGHQGPLYQLWSQ